MRSSPPAQRIPKYCHHRPSGRAVVYLPTGKSYRPVYLGIYSTAGSRQEYDRVVKEWLASGRRTDQDDPITITQLVALFWRHVKKYYRGPDGKITGEVGAYKTALREVKALYGRTPAKDFDQVKLKTVRAQMIEKKWRRKSINGQVHRIRRMFRWAASEKLLPALVFTELQTVEGLKAGRSDARESEPVRPVAIGHVEAVLHFISPTIATAIKVQLLTGMRAGELLIMRTGDVDRSGPLWVYRPRQHKTRHHGHDREIYLGPKAQELITPYLKPNAEAFLFDPRDAEQERRARAHVARTTPPNQGNRPGTNRKRRPKVRPGKRYDVASYRRAITRACDKADLWQKGGRVVDNAVRIIPRFKPHQLRHTAATELRKQFGIEAAQVILGHRNLNVTEIYAEKNMDAAKQIAAQVG